MSSLKLPEGLELPLDMPPLDLHSSFELPLAANALFAPMNLVHIGAFTGIYGGKIGHCQIGRYCSIAPGVDIASDQHPTEWLSSSMVQYVSNLHGWGEWLTQAGYAYESSEKSFNSNESVSIGNDVWIGQGVFIKSGVKIGNGAVVAAHSVVVSDIPAYAVCAGVPAKVKRMRFDDGVVEDMNRIAWWQYNIAGIKGIDFSDVKSALARIEEDVLSGKLTPFIPKKVIYSELALI